MITWVIYVQPLSGRAAPEETIVRRTQQRMPGGTSPKRRMRGPGTEGNKM